MADFRKKSQLVVEERECGNGTTTDGTETLSSLCESGQQTGVKVVCSWHARDRVSGN